MCVLAVDPVQLCMCGLVRDWLLAHLPTFACASSKSCVARAAVKASLPVTRVDWRHITLLGALQTYLPGLCKGCKHACTAAVREVLQKPSKSFGHQTTLRAKT